MNYIYIISIYFSITINLATKRIKGRILQYIEHGFLMQFNSNVIHGLFVKLICKSTKYFMMTFLAQMGNVNLN